jgi:hypothetical protein
MKNIPLFLTCITLGACASMHSDDPHSLFFDIPEGSTFSLNKKLTIDHHDTHALIQHGKVINDNDKNDYDINCRIEFRNFGPRTVEPEVFKITRTEDGRTIISVGNIVRYWTEVYLSSDKGTDIIKMVCQEYDGIEGKNFPVADMQNALGDYVTINFAMEKPAK